MAAELAKAEWPHRPAHYKEPELFEQITTEYFNKCIEKQLPPTIVGLALELGFESRQSIYDYEKRSQPFSYVVKRARMYIENYHEQSLAKQSCAGHIFWLKNNGGYADRSDVALSTPDGPLETRFEIVIHKSTDS